MLRAPSQFDASLRLWSESRPRFPKSIHPTVLAGFRFVGRGRFRLKIGGSEVEGNEAEAETSQACNEVEHVGPIGKEVVDERPAIFKGQQLAESHVADLLCYFDCSTYFHCSSFGRKGMPNEEDTRCR